LWKRFKQWFNKIPWLWVMFWIGVFGIGLVFVTFALSLILHITGVWEWLSMGIPSDARNKYLLSATAQVLGAVFALVFSITLIATQFVTKYTHRTVWIVFNKWILTYVGGFAAAVIFPLWWLVNPVGVGSFLSVGLGSLFVMSVPGFFLYLTQRMNLNGIITELGRIGIQATEQRNSGKAKEMIASLDSIATGAYTDRNYEVFELAVSALGDLALISPDKQQADIFQKLGDTCVGTIADRRAPVKVVETLGRLGVAAIKSNNTNLWQTLGNLFLTIESWCNNTGRKHVSTACADALHEMIFEATPLPISKRGSLNQFTLNGLPGLALASGRERCTNKDFTDNNPYSFLVNNEIHIYKSHIKYVKKDWEGWADLLPNDMGKVQELIISVNANAVFFNDSLIRLLFEYIRLFLEHNTPEWGYEFCSAVREIRESTKPVLNSKPSEILTLMIDSLEKYSDVCRKKWKGTKWTIQWNTIGTDLWNEAKSFKQLLSQSEHDS